MNALCIMQMVYLSLGNINGHVDWHMMDLLLFKEGMMWVKVM